MNTTWKKQLSYEYNMKKTIVLFSELLIFGCSYMYQSLWLNIYGHVHVVKYSIVYFHYHSYVYVTLDNLLSIWH